MRATISVAVQLGPCSSMQKWVTNWISSYLIRVNDVRYWMIVITPFLLFCQEEKHMVHKSNQSLLCFDSNTADIIIGGAYYWNHQNWAE